MAEENFNKKRPKNLIRKGKMFRKTKRRSL